MFENLIQRSPTEAIKLPNKNCAYCGDMLSEDIATDDHVIGKRFVPKSTLSEQWNIILRACAVCNNAKSDLEDDISAITMQPTASGDFASEDARLASEALRKAQGSFSRETRRLVGDSSEQLEFSGEFAPGVTFTVKLSAPPQANPERLYRLSYFHIQGIFFFITFNSVNQCGGFIPGIFKPLMAVNRLDWGNVVIRAFTSLLQSWHPRFAGIAAEEFFKATVRRHPEGKEVWAWALEWNQNCRVIGFFGSEIEVARETAALPVLEKKEVTEGNIIYRVRPEVPLPSEETDLLFAVNL